MNLIVVFLFNKVRYIFVNEVSGNYMFKVVIEKFLLGIGFSVEIIDSFCIKIVFIGDKDKNCYLFGCFLGVIIV